MRFIVLSATLLFFSLPVWAQTSWEDLVRDVQTPLGANPAGPSDPSSSRPDEPLRLPDFAEDRTPASQNRSSEKGGDEKAQVGVKYIFTYQCENPEFPKCLVDMRRFKDYMDLENCKELTKLYLSAVGSYNRCIDRRTKKHANAVVNYFNCYANDDKNCPSLYAD